MRVLALGCAMLLGCGPALLPAPRPIPRKSATVTFKVKLSDLLSKNGLTVGVTPHLKPETLKANLHGVTEYLSGILHVPVTAVVGASYDDTIDRLASGEFDLAFLSPYAYAKARARSRVTPLVSPIAGGSFTTPGYVLVKDSSPIHTLDDLKGQSFAFVDPASASGYLYPLKLMRDRRIDPASYFSSVEFLGNHEAVLLAVYEGRVAAGATYQGAISALHVSRGIDPLSFRIIAKTPRTPRDILAARPDFPAEAAGAVSEALLALDTRHPEGRQMLAPLGYNGFVAADDRAYDTVDQIVSSFDGGLP